jgi:sulfur carrier protein ThiS
MTWRAPGGEHTEERERRCMGLRVKVYLRSPPDVLAPDLPPHMEDTLPEVELPEGATVETLLQHIGVGRARPVVMVNRTQQKGDVSLHEGDRVDLVLPLGGG